MFLGDYTPNMTEGSRIALPKKLRDQIQGDELVLTRGFEQCVFIYDKNDWLDEAKKQIASPITDTKTRVLKRYLYGTAAESLIDAQGRFVIPPALKEYANLIKEVAVIGAGDHIELWNANVWQEYLAKISVDMGNQS